MFILALKSLELTFGSVSSEFFDKIPVRILLDVLSRVFRFSDISIHFVAILALSFTKVCHGNFEISNEH